MVFPVVMYGYESWTIKKAESWRTDAFELWCWRRLLSPLDCKEIQPVHLKGNQSWIFIGRTDAEAENPILWPPDVKNWLIGKYPDSGKDWRQEEKGMIEDEMVGWYHRVKGHEFEQTLWVGDGQGGLCVYMHSFSHSFSIISYFKILYIVLVSYFVMLSALDNTMFSLAGCCYFCSYEHLLEVSRKKVTIIL